MSEAQDNSASTTDITAELTQQLKTKLTQGLALLFQQHQDGIDSDIIVRQRADCIDEAVLAAWQHCFNLDHQSDIDKVSLLAVGGYGRQELNFYSDIDLLVLYPSELESSNEDEARPVDSSLQESTRAFIQLLWDIGLDVGHSVRSIEECVHQGQDDLTIATNMLESRYLAGDETQNPLLQQAIRAENFWSVEDFYNAKYDEQRKRHARFDDIAYSLEPNLKSSPGGLRDIQTIAWVANRAYRTSDFIELLDRGFINAPELDDLLESRRVLWRLRNALHRLCNRSEDRLLIPYQRDLAEQLGYQDDDDQLAVEKLMQAYYVAAKTIRALNHLLLQHFDQSINYQGASTIKAIDADFQFVNDYVSFVQPDLLDVKPSALLKVFRVYQNHPDCRGIDTQTIRSIKNNLHLIDESYRTDIKNTALFLEIFKHESRLTHTIRKLDSYGVLGAFVPVFGQIEGQMQHDLFHAYTVDAHTLMVVRNLRRLVIGDDIEEIPYPTKIIDQCQKRYRLYLGALFHDVAKGRGGNHHELGEKDARSFCLQFGLNDADSNFIAWLVRQHLTMSKTSQREDISDPEVIQAFADRVGDKDHLDCLFVLTVADIRGTSHSTWTPWKGHLLNGLHRNTTAYLDTKNSDSTQDLIENSKLKALTIISGKFSDKQVNRFWDILDSDYFLNYSAKALAWHASEICGAHVLDLPIVVSRYSSNLQTQTYVVYAADTPQLLSAMTGNFDRYNQNIVDARIHVAHPGYTLVIVTLTQSKQVELSQEDVNDRIDDLKQALIQSTQLAKPIQKMVPRRLKEFSIETKIHFKNVEGQDSTTLQLVTLDRPGLMHQVANTFAQNQIKLVSAKISTVGEKVEDVFRITDIYGQALTSNEQLDAIKEALLERLS